MSWLTAVLKRPPIGWWDLADILVVSLLIYWLLKLIRGTRAVQMAVGGGALVAIERQIGLRNYSEGGIPLDARLTYDLLLSIFQPASPLHDGAVIVQGDRVAAAACFLPLTTNPKLGKELGSRHRAAIGLTEEIGRSVV